MYPPKPLFAKAVMILLTSTLTSSSLLGNGFVLAIIVRFKSLRTVHNILIANLALVDLLNSAIKMPIYIIYSVLEASWFRGKTLAVATALLNRVFTFLNLASTLAVMGNVYLAISLDLRYFTWKTSTKALVCAFVTWLISIVVVTLCSIPLFNDINLGEAHVGEYRAVIFKQGRHFAAVMVLRFIIFSGVLGSLTTRSIKKKKKKVPLKTLLQAPFQHSRPKETDCRTF